MNPGAEIVADGSVIVWGRLRGAVAAGAKGNPGAVVCALDFVPMRLQLGDQSLNAADREETGRPEMAVLRDGSIVVESWQSGSIG